MVDGIDGSGKSTVIDAWKELLEKQQKRILSLRLFWKEHDRHPNEAEIGRYTVILSAEPTFVGIGKKIREEMIVSNTAYTPKQIAEAYAEDRKELYTAVIIPALKKGLIIIQDRGVSTSLCYQPLHDAHITADAIAQIPGNAFALAYPPNHLVLVDVEPKIAMSRLGKREKQDHALFERADFLKKARKRFLEPAYQEIFRKRGTAIHILNGAAPLDIMKQEAKTLLQSLL